MDNNNNQKNNKPKKIKVLTGQNIENGLNYKQTPVINEQIKTNKTAIFS